MQSENQFKVDNYVIEVSKTKMRWMSSNEESKKSTNDQEQT